MPVEVEITNLPEVALMEIVQTGVNWQALSFWGNVFVGASTLALAAFAFFTIKRDAPNLKFFMIKLFSYEKIGISIYLNNKGTKNVTILRFHLESSEGMHLDVRPQETMNQIITPDKPFNFQWLPSEDTDCIIRSKTATIPFQSCHYSGPKLPPIPEINCHFLGIPRNL